MRENADSVEYAFDELLEASERLKSACEKIEEFIMAVKYLTEENMIHTEDASDSLSKLVGNIFRFHNECGPVLVASKRIINSASEGPFSNRGEGCDFYENVHDIFVNKIAAFIRDYCINFPYLSSAVPNIQPNSRMEYYLGDSEEKLVNSHFRESIKTHQIAFDIDSHVSLLRDSKRWKLFRNKGLTELVKSAEETIYGQSPPTPKDFITLAEDCSRLVLERDRIWMKSRGQAQNQTPDIAEDLPARDDGPGLKKPTSRATKNSSPKKKGKSISQVKGDTTLLESLLYGHHNIINYNEALVETPLTQQAILEQLGWPNDPKHKTRISRAFRNLFPTNGYREYTSAYCSPEALERTRHKDERGERFHAD